MQTMLSFAGIRKWLVVALIVTAAPAALAQTSPAVKTEIATFAGGCFWCVESDFDKVEGVLSTVSGFMGGKTQNPTYKQVSGGGTGHAEVVQVAYDPARVSYQHLLDVFWRTVDPLDAGGQFCDRGDEYRTGIFTHSAEQQRLAEASKAALDGSRRFDRKIVTAVTPASQFTPAEDYHQDYYKKNPLQYRFYRFNCGRDARLKQLWRDEAGGKVPTQ
jgi:methionine-S-sulfoxide reductase